METATEQHFFHHGQDSQVPRSERQSCHFCQLRAFATHKDFPITIVNETNDGAVISSNFRFIDHSTLGPGVSVAEKEFRTGCDCPNAEACMYAECKCLDEVEVSDDQHALEEDDDDDYENLEGHDNKSIARQRAEAQCGKLDRARQRGSRNGQRAPHRPTNGHGHRKITRTRKKQIAYHTQGAKVGLLRGSYLNSRAPIYECHEACHCSKWSCPNRVVERGRKVPLQIFRTGNGRGWGVRTQRELKRGQFVDFYVGEVITPQEADKRRHNASKAQRKDVYLFGLDKFTDPESMDLRLVGAPLEVDGEFMSGPTRFVNHSCDPNLRIFARVGDHADKHIHDLALFATRDITKGEELTFDYVDGQGEVDNSAKDEKVRGEMTKCLCGSNNCRGYLW